MILVEIKLIPDLREIILKISLKGVTGNVYGGWTENAVL